MRRAGDVTQPNFARWGWPAVLGLVTFGGTLVFACLTPLAALAAVAAATTRMRAGALVVGLCWLAKQIVGFGLLGYPRDLPTLLNGLSLLFAGGFALLVARYAHERLSRGPIATGLAAFAAFEAGLLLPALVQGDITMFAPDIVALVVANEALWLIALWLLAGVVHRLAPGWLASGGLRA